MTAETVVDLISCVAPVGAIAVAFWTTRRMVRSHEANMALQARLDMAWQVVDWAADCAETMGHWMDDLTMRTERESRFDELCGDRYFVLEHRVVFAFGATGSIARSLAAMRDGLDRIDGLVGPDRDLAMPCDLAQERATVAEIDSVYAGHFAPAHRQLYAELAAACHLPPTPSSPRVIERPARIPAHP